MPVTLALRRVDSGLYGGHGMAIGDEHLGTIVVGGSQAGLAVGYHLARHGLPFVILDAHDHIGDAWRRRWDSLRLFTMARYSALPGMPFPGPPRAYPTKDEVADYLRAYAARFDLPVRTGVRVEHLGRRGDGFELTTGDGDVLTADSVVIATGSAHEPRVPAFAAGLDPGVRQLHSSEYRHPSQLREGPVLVVGAGNSGAEIALELARTRQTWLSGRDPGQEPTRAGSLADRLLMPLVWFAATRVLSVRTPIGRRVRRQFLEPPRGIPLGRVRRRDIAAAGIERVPRTADVRDGCPVLSDGRVLEVANVVWCTGFTPGLGWVDLPITGDHGQPVHDEGVVPTEPGLFFVGVTFQRSLSSSLVGGVGRDAGQVADHVAARSGRTDAATAVPA
jgi:putative flavoprotein involved in K+ transport